MIKKQPYVLRRVAGETILIPLRGEAADLDAIYVLNETAAFLWAQLDQSDDPATLAERLRRTFEVSHTQVVADVADFLNALAEAGLIHGGEKAARQAA